MPKRFAGLTAAQQRVFEQIATGNDAAHNPGTLAALVRHGMIETDEERYGPWITYRYYVPVAWHIRWCQWCAEQPDIEVTK